MRRFGARTLLVLPLFVVTTVGLGGSAGAAGSGPTVASGVTSLVSVARGGGSGNGYNDSADTSADGR